MPGIIKQEIVADQPVRGIAEDITAALIESQRGVPNKPQLVTDFGQFMKYSGYYEADKYSAYSIRGFFNNGGKNLWVNRLVGEDATSASGADGDKVALTRTQVVHGSGTAELDVVAEAAGVAGADLTLTVSTNVSDVSAVEVVNSTDIELKIASTSAWKKTAMVCSYVLNGHSMVIISGGAVPDAANSVAFYAKTPGTAGDDYSVVVVDTSSGGLSYAYDTTGYILTIDLGGTTPTASAVVAGMPSTGELSAFVVGAGTGTWTVTVSASPLVEGNDTIASLVTASVGSTGVGTVTTSSKAYFLGTGSVTAASDIFADTTVVGGFDTLASKIIPGSILVIANGANKGAYTVTGVPSSTTLQLDRNFVATQANCLYRVYGTDNAYGYVSVETTSPGEGGDGIYVTITKEYGGTSLRVVVSVQDSDGSSYELETFNNLSPIPTDPTYIGTVINRDSIWVDIAIAPENIISYGTGTSTASSTTLTDASSLFISEGVVAGDYVAVESATTSADVKVFEVEEVLTETTLKLDSSFVGTQADVIYKVLGADTSGAKLLALVGSDGIVLTMSGGVDDDPISTDYIGSSVDKSGVYFLDNIPVAAKPRKLFAPDVVGVTDSTGSSAMDTVNKALGETCETYNYLRYTWMALSGKTPAQAISLAENDLIDSKFSGEYYNWGYMSDPLTGRSKLCPLVGHMNGLADAVASGPEGAHQPLANIPLRDVDDLEYEVTDPEYTLLCEANINCIRKINGIRNMGDYMRTSDSAWRWMHKRDITLILINSIYRSLGSWTPWSLMVPGTLGKVRKAVSAFLRKYDRRIVPNGALLNQTDPSEIPYYIACDLGNNDLKGTVLTAEVGLSIVNVVETVVIRYGLWAGGSSVSTS